MYAYFVQDNVTVRSGCPSRGIRQKGANLKTVTFQTQYMNSCDYYLWGTLRDSFCEQSTRFAKKLKTTLEEKVPIFQENRSVACQGIF